MEAVIATGGKQYRVAPGQVIKVERLGAPIGSPVEFKRRKNYRRHRGHRQTMTTVRITSIEA